MKLIYCAIPRENFSYRWIISRYVFDQGEIPLNPFTLFDYRLAENESREDVIEACHELVKRSDYVRVFGGWEKDGVKEEIKIARENQVSVLFHDIEEVV